MKVWCHCTLTKTTLGSLALKEIDWKDVGHLIRSKKEKERKELKEQEEEEDRMVGEENQA